jgi:hypothetical protein
MIDEDFKKSFWFKLAATLIAMALILKVVVLILTITHK